MTNQNGKLLYVTNNTLMDICMMNIIEKKQRYVPTIYYFRA